METNTRILITFLIIVLVIVAFGFGYFVASTRAENRFLNVHTKIAKLKMDMFFKEKENFSNMKVKKVDPKDLPPDFIKFIEELEKEEEEENDKNEK